MRHFFLWTFGFLLSLLTSRENPERSKLRAMEEYGRLAMAFEANEGQSDARVKFLSRGNGYSVFLTPGEVVMTLRRAERKSQAPAVLRMKFPDGNPKAEIAGVDELPGKSNYFIGNDPGKWRTNVPTYAQVRYQGVYPGIDLIYYGQQGQLEYDFEVSPAADPKTIRLVLEGAERLRVDSQGDLVSEAQGAEIRFRRPVIYQLNPSAGTGGKQFIEGRYVLRAAKPASGNSMASTLESQIEVGFEIGGYDARRTLVIDPVLLYSTYLGGRFDDPAYGIAVDSAGSAYVTGYTISPDFPTANPLQPSIAGNSDAFVAKLNTTGSALLYSTYLGGSDAEWPFGIAVDSAGNAYLTGYTSSTNFPTTNPLQPAYGGGFSDAFVVKLNPTGSRLLYSTYLGGTDFDRGNGIAVDSAGNAYVTGSTGSNDFPTANPLQPERAGIYDAFVARLDPTGSSLIYSTYLGGSGLEYGNGIAVDSAGNAYVTGSTESTDFPTVNPLQPANAGLSDAFVASLDPAGSTLIYSTYLGGSGLDDGYGIAVDSAGNAYVTGSTGSADFPTASPLQPATTGGFDAFVTMLDPTGSTLIFSTYLGGSSGDFGYGIAVDSAGNVYASGDTSSDDFPTANPLQPARAGGFEAFIATLDPIASTLTFSTYLGGSNDDSGFGIAVDSAGNAYVSGHTSSTNFPTADPLQPTNHGTVDAFVAKLGP